MLITIKPHSVFKEYFSQQELRVDIDKYTDLVDYLNAMQPAFTSYIRKQEANEHAESFVFLDKNLNQINIEEFKLKRPKSGDIIYIVPAIVGAGGKRGGLVAFLAVAAMLVFAPAAIGLAGAGAAGAAGATTAAVGTGVGAGLSGFVQNIAINMGLAVLSSLFLKKPPAQQEANRQNDYFGSLTNTTASGIPVGLNYGMVRVAGQTISLYLQTYSRYKEGTNIIVDPKVPSILSDPKSV